MNVKVTTVKKIMEFIYKKRSKKFFVKKDIHYALFITHIQSLKKRKRTSKEIFLTRPVDLKIVVSLRNKLPSGVLQILSPHIIR